MITGFIQQWDAEKHLYPKAFDTAIAYLSGRDVAALEPGKYPIDEEKIFALVQKLTTAPIVERRFELHHEFIDIQVLLQGHEKQGYAPLYPSGAPTEDNLVRGDIAFYPFPKDAQTLLMVPGQYVVYLPRELHCPCCAVDRPQNITKVVLKIHKDCVGQALRTP